VICTMSTNNSDIFFMFQCFNRSKI
jgi:hypothetical protein